MKRALPRRVPFFVTMLTAALIVVGWRVAGAGPCIGDGQTCRTNDSCCSRVCAKSSKKSFGTCCSPTTCAAEGANCGMIADGCGGTLDCGTCTLPETCGGGGTPNVCGTAIQCCVQSSPMGAFDTCTVETSAQCAAQGGIALGSGTCSPNPCPPSPSTSTSTSTSTTTTSTSTTTCPTATAFYCGSIGPPPCGGGAPSCPPFGALCPSGMTCTGSGTTCGCTGEAIPCGDPRLSGLTCNFCRWGTCPLGMTCGGVPKSGACGFDCACH